MFSLKSCSGQNMRKTNESIPNEMLIMCIHICVGVGMYAKILCMERNILLVCVCFVDNLFLFIAQHLR